MTATSTRRAVLAGAAAVPALSLPAIAAEPDPIFAAIGRHRVTFRRRLETSDLACRTPDGGSEANKPENIAIHDAADVALCEDATAAFELAYTQPTTMAGVLALIDYVKMFNEGKFRINKDWQSAPYNWPDAINFEFEGAADPSGELGMAYAVLLNVRDALKTLAA